MIQIIRAVHGNVIVDQERISLFQKEPEDYQTVIRVKIKELAKSIIFLLLLEIIKVIMKRPILNLKSGQRMIIRDPKNNPHRNEIITSYDRQDHKNKVSLFMVYTLDYSL